MRTLLTILATSAVGIPAIASSPARVRPDDAANVCFCLSNADDAYPCRESRS
jgi:hypothetical protein